MRTDWTNHWTEHERRRLIAEAEARDAREQQLLPATSPARIKDNPLARAARKDDRKRVYARGMWALVAVLIGALSVAMITQANATRLNWPEIQAEAAR